MSRVSHNLLSRRRALGFGLGAFVLPQATARAAPRNTARGVILVMLEGGMSQFESWDPKPAAPKEVRGEFGAIASSLPGVQVGEHVPLMAAELHRGNLLRAVHCDARNDHSPGMHLLLTGYENVAAGVALERKNYRNPSVGSILSWRLGVAAEDGAPRFVALPHATQLNGQVNYNGPSFLGAAYEGFETGDSPKNSQQPFAAPPGLVLARDLSPARLRTRLDLAAKFDLLRANLDRRPAPGRDAHYERAAQVLTGRRTQEAFELEREPPEVRRAYGDTELGQGLLLARRLIDAGVTYVVVNAGDFGNWDTHSNNFNLLKTRLLPPMDRGVSALLRDLDDRGALDDVLVLVAGEMGRTPLVNNAAGRDHWTSAFPVFIAGGGLTRGQVLGATTADGSYPTRRPLTVHEILATVYHRLGVDPHTLLTDPEGRAVPILPEGEPIPELLG